MAMASVYRVDYFGFLKSFRKWWWFYALMIVLGLGIGITFCLILPSKYKAISTLLPNQSKESKFNRLEAIASRFGIDSPVAGNNFVDFLEPIIGSKTFLLKLADFPVERPSGNVRLYDSFKYPRKSPILDSLIYLSNMRGMIKYQKKSSGMVEISVTADTPGLAAGLVNQITMLINEFSQEYNFATLRAHVAYLSDQTATALGAKSKKNENLVRFLENNRGIDPTVSPALFARYSDLKTEAEIANQKYLLLRNQLESAELGLTKKESILMILDYASEPYFKDSPKRKQILATYFLVAIILSFLIHITREILVRMIRAAMAEAARKV